MTISNGAPIGVAQVAGTLRRNQVQQCVRFYQELSEWWPLFSPAIHYVEEAQDLRRRLAPLPAPGTTTLLELGSGGGSLASHLKDQFTLTLTDLSEGMLAQSRAINPEAEHIQGDMRALRLNREFGYVLVHDAVCYMTTAETCRKRSIPRRCIAHPAAR